MSILGKFPFFLLCLPKILHTAKQEILKTPCGVEDNMETPACAWVFLPEIADSRSSSRREQRVEQWGPTRLRGNCVREVAKDGGKKSSGDCIQLEVLMFTISVVCWNRNLRRWVGCGRSRDAELRCLLGLLPVQARGKVFRLPIPHVPPSNFKRFSELEILMFLAGIF